MQLAVLCAVCLLPSSLALPLPPEAGGMSEPQWEQAQNYLKRFYPSDPKTRGANSLEAKLKEMQKFFRLPITGMLNSRIIEIMQKPRCGMPDVAEYSLFSESPKWTSKIVTYRIISYTRDLSHFQVNQLVEKAFEMWSKEIPLHFKRIRWGIADIMIGFARGAHGDSYPFDGPGNTLAHAFLPGPGLGGDAHFDEDERWTDGSSTGINFLYAATHELGHSLGLGHSSDPNAVMYPTYGDNDSKNFKLSQDDIKEIQKLYGCVPRTLILQDDYLNQDAMEKQVQKTLSTVFQERGVIEGKITNQREHTFIGFIGFYIIIPQPELMNTVSALHLALILSFLTL